MGADIIQKIVDSISVLNKNRVGDIYLNVINNEFITFHGKIEVPRISVKELDFTTAVEIVEGLYEYIPEFLFQHHLLKDRKPASDILFLHFIRPLKGRLLKFIHMLKIDFKFGGDSTNITRKGNTDYHPSYVTDRMYYKSLLIPADYNDAGNALQDFSPVRLKDADYIKSDEHFYTFALFDELNYKELSVELCKIFDQSIFPISLGLYPFIVYEYFTACFSVLNPVKDEISYALQIFEIMFIYIYSKFKEIDGLMDPSMIEKEFGDVLDYSHGKLNLKDTFIEMMRQYFNRFKLYSDDELMLKGWRRFEVS